MRRVGLLGDVHAEDERLKTALSHFDAKGVDAVLSVGDIVDGPGDVEATIDMLRAREVIAVAGNHERWLLANQMRSLDDATQSLSDDARAWIATLPRTRTLDTVAGPLLLCHGVGEDDMVRLIPECSEYDLQHNAALQRILAADEVRVMVGGHTHRRMVRRIGALTAINPGTLYRGYDPCFALADLETMEVEFTNV